MLYREYVPHPALRPYVKCFWAMEHDYSSGSHREEWLPASAEVELIFHCGNRFEVLTENQGERKQICFVMGQQERHTILRSGGYTRLAAVRFEPWGAFPFFGVAVSELSNRIVALDLVWGRQAGELEEQLQSLQGRAAIDCLEKYCLQRLDDAHGALTPVSAFARHIIGTGGRRPISALLDVHGVGQRQMERKFLTYVGMSPKRLAQLTRFQRALQAIISQPRQELTSIAYAGGYSDQSHLIKEFHQFYGKTPSQVRAWVLAGLPDGADVEFLQSRPDTAD
jgi:AraC-like DNA-binding protein